MKKTWLGISVLSLIVLLGLVLGCRQSEDEGTIEDEAKGNLQTEQIPQVVMDALKAKFPKAEIDKWTKEKEGDIVIYDFEFKQEGRKFEADIKEDGSIYNWEKAIEKTDLPEAALKTVETKYPQSTLKEIMEITAVIEGKDVLEGYEVVLETADKREVEITVAADGRIL